MSSIENKWNKETLVPLDWDFKWVSRKDRQIYFDTKVGNLYQMQRQKCWDFPIPKKELYIFLGARVGHGKYTELTFYHVSACEKLINTLYHGEREEDFYLISKKKED